MAEHELNGPGHDLGVYVIIPAVPGSTEGGVLGETVLRFLDQPVLQESRGAQYEAESLLHAPESFQAYTSTEQREFTIDGRFFCRNEADVQTNSNIINVVRSLVMPDYNNSGSPPVPVKLYAYGTWHLHGLPCLVKSYDFTFPNDVDYISINGISMPVIFNIALTLSEQHSVKQLRSFSLADFRAGDMVSQGF